MVLKRVLDIRLENLHWQRQIPVGSSDARRVCCCVVLGSSTFSHASLVHPSLELDRRRPCQAPMAFSSHPAPEWVGSPPQDDYLRWGQSETLARLAAVLLGWLGGASWILRRSWQGCEATPPNPAGAVDAPIGRLFHIARRSGGAPVTSVVGAQCFDGHTASLSGYPCDCSSAQHPDFSDRVAAGRYRPSNAAVVVHFVPDAPTSRLRRRRASRSVYVFMRAHSLSLSRRASALALDSTRPRMTGNDIIARAFAHRGFTVLAGTG